MAKKLLALPLAFFLLAGTAVAQTAPARTQGIREEFQRKQVDVKRTFQDAAERLREEFDARKAELRRAAREQKEILKKQLEAVKDARKKQIVEKISSSLAELHMRMLDRFSSALEKLAQALTRVEERTRVAEDAGRDIRGVQRAITAAKQALEDARTAVLAQGAKTYALSIQDETTLRSVVKDARDKLHRDLMQARDAVQAAKSAVVNAAAALSQSLGVATSSNDNRP